MSYEPEIIEPYIVGFAGGGAMTIVPHLNYEEPTWYVFDNRVREGLIGRSRTVKGAEILNYIPSEHLLPEILELGARLIELPGPDHNRCFTDYCEDTEWISDLITQEAVKLIRSEDHEANREAAKRIVDMERLLSVLSYTANLIRGEIAP